MIPTDYLQQIGTLALLVGTGIGASVMHSIIKNDKWTASENNVLALVYSLVLAVLDLWLKGLLHFSGIVPAFLAIYGASQAWYATVFAVTSSETKSSLPTNPNP